MLSRPGIRPTGAKGSPNSAGSGKGPSTSLPGRATPGAGESNVVGGSRPKIAPAGGQSGIRPKPTTGATSSAAGNSGSGTKLPAKRSDDEEYGLLETGDASPQQKNSPSEIKSAPQKKGPAPQVTLATTGPSPYDQVTRAAEIDFKAPGPTLIPIEDSQKSTSLLPLYLTLGAVAVVIVIVGALVLLS